MIKTVQNIHLFLLFQFQQLPNFDLIDPRNPRVQLL